MKYVLLFSLFISAQAFATQSTQDLGSFDVKEPKTTEMGEEAIFAASFGSFDLNIHNSRLPASVKADKNWNQDPHVTEITGTFK